MDIIQVLWTLVFIFAFLPILKQYRINSARLRILRLIQRQRASQIITLIHRQEFLSFLGIPLTRFINIEDSELILRAIRLTPDHVPIDLVLHTPGGLVLAAEQIASALQKHPAKVTVFVPHYAMSGGTMIALAADEIVMDENAVLGPVDPQVGKYPAVSILKKPYRLAAVVLPVRLPFKGFSFLILGIGGLLIIQSIQPLASEIIMESL